MTEPNGRIPTSDQSIADLTRRLSEQTKTLVRQEVELAKAELGEKGKRVGVGAGMFGGAGLFGLFALAALTACLILALSEAMAPWLAALIVTVAYGAIAGVLALSAKKQVQEATPPMPEQTVETVKEDVASTKQRAQAGRR
ncbi:MAG: hypothetical protein QOG94_1049 [Solirubrobacteraceae bacterium]|jgi:uncharacterized membrane protein YqjE|nr:hypothetical protein [Solirubrobacteraceae bacterium]MEA2137310.1 hypothetical protein [Solirubrobacteraceae bacterium]